MPHGARLQAWEPQAGTVYSGPCMWVPLLNSREEDHKPVLNVRNLPNMVTWGPEMLRQGEQEAFPNYRCLLGVCSRGGVGGGGGRCEEMHLNTAHTSPAPPKGTPGLPQALPATFTHQPRHVWGPNLPPGLIVLPPLPPPGMPLPWRPPTLRHRFLLFLHTVLFQKGISASDRPFVYLFCLPSVGHHLEFALFTAESIASRTLSGTRVNAQ